jgi:hypothetical protein
VSRFKAGDSVIYSRSRAGSRPAQDIAGTYVGECEAWGNGFRPHQIRCVLNGVERNLFVSIDALRRTGKDDPLRYRGWDIVKSVASGTWRANHESNGLTLQNEGVGYPDIESIQDAIDRHEDRVK